MRASKFFHLAVAMLTLAGTVATSRAVIFSWTAGADVPAPLLNSQDADAGVVQDGANLWVQTSLYPHWYRYAGTTMDNLVALPEAVRDASFGPPNQADPAYWIDGIWQDTAGKRYAIIHIEYNYAVSRQAFLWKRRIALATSSDQGVTWTLIGDIITVSPTRAGAPAPATAFQDFGCGDTYLFVDRRGGYFYLYYMTGWVYQATGWRTGQVMSVARCAISDVMAPGKWFKWSGGTWTQPGLGGAEDPVFAGLGTGGTDASGTDMSVVHFNTYLNAFVAIGHDTDTRSWISTCSDITLQNWQPLDYTFPQRLYWYNWPIDPSTNDPYQIGQNFRLYSAQANVNGVGTKYFPLAFTLDAPPTASLVSPVEGAVSYSLDAINLVAAAADTDGSVARVEFFANQIEIGAVTAPPYVFPWPSVAAGQYKIFVRATDNQGATTDSTGVDITVTANTYSAWRTHQGIAASVADNAVQANGLSPLLSYALNIYNAAELPQSQRVGGSLTLTYSRLRSDVTYLVESSPDLSTWTSTLVNQGTVAASGLITATVPISGNKPIFLHLQVTNP